MGGEALLDAGSCGLKAEQISRWDCGLAHPLIHPNETIAIEQKIIRQIDPTGAHRQSIEEKIAWRTAEIT